MSTSEESSVLHSSRYPLNDFKNPIALFTDVLGIYFLFDGGPSLVHITTQGIWVDGIKDQWSGSKRTSV
jgi:hypothetical protein